MSREEDGRYSTDFGGQGFREGERPLGFCGPLHAVPQRPYTLLPVSCKACPLDFPQCGIAEVGNVGSHSGDGFAKGIKDIILFLGWPCDPVILK